VPSHLSRIRGCVVPVGLSASLGISKECMPSSAGNSFHFRSKVQFFFAFAIELNHSMMIYNYHTVELVDCDKLDEGCNGGLPENAYKALEKLGGLETEGDYPYDGHNDKCQFNSTKVAAKVSGFVEVSKNETEMAAWLVKNGPISIGINANAMQVSSFANDVIYLNCS